MQHTFPIRWAAHAEAEVVKVMESNRLVAALPGGMPFVAVDIGLITGAPLMALALKSIVAEQPGRYPQVVGMLAGLEQAIGRDIPLLTVGELFGELPDVVAAATPPAPAPIPPAPPLAPAPGAPPTEQPAAPAPAAEDAPAPRARKGKR